MGKIDKDFLQNNVAMANIFPTVVFDNSQHFRVSYGGYPC